MAVSDYKTNPDENTTISGINIAEGCPPSGINNAIRQLMADVKQNSDKQSSEFSKVMTGSTASAAGASGNVPAPQAGDQNKPLTGGGNYADSLDCDITGNAKTATGLYNADGEPIDAQALAVLLSKYLPITGGTVTGITAFSDTVLIDRQMPAIKGKTTGMCIDLVDLGDGNKQVRFRESDSDPSTDGTKGAVIDFSAATGFIGWERIMTQSTGATFLNDAVRVFNRMARNDKSAVLPEGGTWAYFRNCEEYSYPMTNTLAGGSYIPPDSGHVWSAIAIKISK